MLFNKIWGLKSQNVVDLKEKFSNLQKRMVNAQRTGDPYEMRQLQLEVNFLAKSMMKKQFLPLCARCILFFGVYIILDVFVFFDYRTGLLPFPILFFGDGWISLYFLFSIGFFLLIYGCKWLYRKVTGKEKKKGFGIRSLLNDLSINPPNTYSGGPSVMLDSSSSEYSIQNKDQEFISEDNEDIGSPDSRWKDKLQK